MNFLLNSARQPVIFISVQPTDGYTDDVLKIDSNLTPIENWLRRGTINEDFPTSKGDLLEKDIMESKEVRNLAVGATVGSAVSSAGCLAILSRVRLSRKVENIIAYSCLASIATFLGSGGSAIHFNSNIQDGRRELGESFRQYLDSIPIYYSIRLNPEAQFEPREDVLREIEKMLLEGIPLTQVFGQLEFNTKKLPDSGEAFERLPGSTKRAIRRFNAKESVSGD